MLRFVHKITIAPICGVRPTTTRPQLKHLLRLHRRRHRAAFRVDNDADPLNPVHTHSFPVQVLVACGAQLPYVPASTDVGDVPSARGACSSATACGSVSQAFTVP